MVVIMKVGERDVAGINRIIQKPEANSIFVHYYSQKKHGWIKAILKLVPLKFI
jgi:hypothetical protein